MRRPAQDVHGRRAWLRGRGATFVEIMIAAAIMAAAFIPIAGYIRDSMRQERYEKMEAAAASWIQGKMNEYLVTKPWDQVVSASGTDHLDHEGTKLEIIWDVQVRAVLTGGSQFYFKHITYHTPCGSPTESNVGTVVGSATDKEDFLRNLDREAGAGADASTEYLREIVLTVKWHWPGEPVDDPRRCAAFITRRALLR